MSAQVGFCPHPCVAICWQEPVEHHLIFTPLLIPPDDLASRFARLAVLLILAYFYQGVFEVTRLCPVRRLAPMSEGRIHSDGTLMCSYHGWRFQGDGQCVDIPQSLDAKANATACASSRSCIKAHPVKVCAQALAPGSLKRSFQSSSPDSGSRLRGFRCKRACSCKAQRLHERIEGGLSPCEDCLLMLSRLL